MLTPPKRQRKEWEEEFDEKFSLPPDIGDATAGIGYVPQRKPVFMQFQEVKSFIQSQLSLAFQQGREDTLEEAKHIIADIFDDSEVERFVQAYNKLEGVK